jgi:hypothetical protein
MLAKYSRWSAAELDDQLAAVGLSIGFPKPALEPRLSADVAQIGTQPVDVDRRAGEQEYLGTGRVHRGGRC